MSSSDPVEARRKQWAAIKALKERNSSKADSNTSGSKKFQVSGETTPSSFDKENAPGSRNIAEGVQAQSTMINKEDTISIEAAEDTASIKAAEPCSEFQIDIKSESFGLCICGFPKAEHDAKAFAKKRSSGRSIFSPIAKEATGACNHFQVDITAEKFGMCKCGYHRSSHAMEHRSATKAAGKALFVAAAKDELKGCDSYKVDVNAEAFGICVCGMPKTAHAEYDGEGPVLKALKAEESIQEERKRLREMKRLEEAAHMDCVVGFCGLFPSQQPRRIFTYEPSYK